MRGEANKNERGLLLCVVKEVETKDCMSVFVCRASQTILHSTHHHTGSSTD